MAKKQVIDPANTPYTIVIQSDDKPRPLLMGLLIGAAVGGVAAWLLSPRSGKQSRESIARVASSVQSVAQEQLYKAQTTVRSVVNPDQ